MHLDEDQIQRLIDGELPAGGGISLRAHLEECAYCRECLEREKQEDKQNSVLLRHLDHRLPTIEVEAVRSGPRGSDWKRRVAILLVVLGTGGLAYAFPGSPLRALPGWVESAARQVAARIAGGRPASSAAPVHALPPANAPSVRPAHAPAPAKEATDAEEAGIAVPPGRDLLILFISRQVVGQARVLLADGPDVVVRAVSGSAVFSSALDRLVIGNRGSSATFEIRLPRDAPRVEIRLGENRLFLKEGVRVTTEATADAEGLYHLPLNRSE